MKFGGGLLLGQRCSGQGDAQADRVPILDWSQTVGQSRLWGVGRDFSLVLQVQNWTIAEDREGFQWGA